MAYGLVICLHSLLRNIVSSRPTNSSLHFHSSHDNHSSALSGFTKTLSLIFCLLYPSTQTFQLFSLMLFMFTNGTSIYCATSNRHDLCFLYYLISIQLTVLCRERYLSPIFASGRGTVLFLCFSRNIKAALWKTVFFLG